MFSIAEDGTIQLTRGDTARFSIGVTNDITGFNYDVASDDTITFTVKKKVTDKTPLLQKNVIGCTVIHIKPTDTQELSFGRYVYDVQITTVNGDVYTIIEPTSFILLTEVTY